MDAYTRPAAAPLSRRTVIKNAGLAAAALAGLVDDPDRCRAMGSAARARTVAEFGYDRLAGRLGEVLARW